MKYTKNSTAGIIRIILDVVVTAIVFSAVFALQDTVASAATNYNVWIGGTQITSANCGSNTAWRYDNGTRTLTLNGYSYSGKGHKGKITETDEDGETEDFFYNAPIYSNGSLNIVLNGTSKVTSQYEADSDYEPVGVFVKGDLTIRGTGSLTAAGGAKSELESFGIYSFEGDITLESGDVTATGGQDYYSGGISCTNGTLSIESGKLTAAGGAIYSGDEDSATVGIETVTLFISGGNVKATGGTASAGYSCGITAEDVVMTGGELNAAGGTAKVLSSGISVVEGSYIIGGTASLTGGSCSAGSYGIEKEKEDDYIDEDEEDYYEAVDEGNYILVISESALVTVKGNTAAANNIFYYSYDESDLIPSGDEEDEEDDADEDNADEASDDDGSEFEDDADDIDDDIEDDIEDEDYDEGDDCCARYGEYYIYDGHYAPVITVSGKVDGTSSKVYKAPDPEIDLYTTNKYVSVRPAVLPSSISLSQTQIRTGSSEYETTINVDYLPDDADIKGVRWRSDNRRVATVDQDGTVRTHATGNADVTAEIGSVKATCNVICDPGAYISRIDIDSGFNSLWIHDKDDELRLEVIITPYFLRNTKLEWSSSDSSIASVDQNGVVRGLKDGKVTITAKDPLGETRDTCEVKVHLTRDVSEMELTGLQDDYNYTGYNVLSRFYNIDLEGLTSREDYVYITENAVFPGTGTLIIKGKNKYYGTKEINFNIAFDSSTIISEGACGDDLSWCITSGNNLLIVGSGEMYDYTGAGTTNEAPWNDYTGKIKGIWFSSGCTRIGNNAFSGLQDPGITDLYLPDTVKSIGERAFCGLDSTGSVRLDLPINLVTIENYAFSGSSIFRDGLVIPDSVTSIGEGAFEGACNLSYLSIGKGIHTIEPYTFAYCTGLRNVQLPSDLAVIKCNAFRFCSFVQEIDIPESLTEIESDAFSKCGSLKEVRFSGKAPTISNDSFDGCNEELILTHLSGAAGWDSSSLSGWKIVNAHVHNGRLSDKTCATFGHNGREIIRCSICGMTISSRRYPKIKSASLSQTEYIFINDEHEPEVTVTDAEGSMLSEGTDYRVQYSKNINAGRATANIVFFGDYAGSKKLDFTISAADISEHALSLSRKQFTCNGKTRRPSINVEGCEADDYEIEWSTENSRKIGEYTVIVKGKGNYTGTLSETYTIVPKKTKIRSILAGRRSVIVKWRKLSKKMAGKRISGYQIQYSTSRKFKTSRKRTVKGYKKTTRRIKKLKSGKRYYFRIRTYSTVKGKKYYSSWSKVRKTRIK